MKISMTKAILTEKEKASSINTDERALLKQSTGT